jgi:hypothetical protein
MSRQKVSQAQRRRVIERARGICEYCYSQMAYSSDPFNAEHIIPRSRDGVTALHNLALSCFGCNNKKWTYITGRDSVTQTLAPLYHPRRDRWADHFEWNATCTMLLGLTPTGRATIDLLELNRPGVVNLRRILYAYGEHPPAPVDD